jgi:hypothetical protein
MGRPRIVLLTIAAVLLPVVLAVAGWLIVSSVFASADSIPLPVRPSVTASAQPQPTQSGDDGSRGSESPTGSGSPSGSGRCSEAEHRNDPSCLGSASPSPGGSGDGSGSDPSGKGSGDGSGSDGSGSGKSGSGGDD